MKKIMMMTTEGGKSSIQEVTVDDLHDNMEILYKMAARGKSIYRDMAAHGVGDKQIELINTIRNSSDTKEASVNLQNKLGIKRATAEYILELPLTSLGRLNNAIISDKLAYYTLAEKNLKELTY